MKIVLSSLYMRGSQTTLKFASFYAQQIVIPRSFAGMLSPTGERLAGGLETGVVSEVYYTLPERVEAQLKPLISDGLVTVDHEPDSRLGDPPEEFENAFDSIKATIFQSGSADGVLHALAPELDLLAKGFSPCLDAEQINHYEVVRRFYAFQAKTYLAAATRNRCSLLTDSEVTNI